MSNNSFGTFASFPPGGIVAAGDWFKCIDSPLSAVAMSGSWSDAQWFYEDDPISLPPALAGFTAENASTITTIDQSHGYIYMRGTGTSGSALFYKAIPATPYTFTVGFKINYVLAAPGSRAFVGIGIRSSGGAIVGFGFFVQASTTNPILALYKGPSAATGLNTVVTDLTDEALYTSNGGKIYFSYTDDGTTLTFKRGIDKNNLDTFFSISRASIGVTPAFYAPFLGSLISPAELLIFDQNM